MPNLVGLSKALTYRIMAADHLYFTTHGPGASAGKWVSVEAQSVPAGRLVASLSQVTLAVSMAPAHDPFATPRLIGMDRTQVINTLQNAGLYFASTGPGASTDTWVDVLSQSPAPGAPIRYHGTVTIHVTTRRPVPVTTTTRPIATTTTSTTTSTTTTTYPGETTTSTSSTTTTTVPVTTTTRAPSRSHDYRIGDATWYSYIPGRCATSYLPFGLRLTVRDLATGRAIVCITSDREAARGNRVVDLSETQFAQLAPLAKGVIRVRVSW